MKHPDLRNETDREIQSQIERLGRLLDTRDPAGILMTDADKRKLASVRGHYVREKNKRWRTFNPFN